MTRALTYYFFWFQRLAYTALLIFFAYTLIDVDFFYFDQTLLNQTNFVQGVLYQFSHQLKDANPFKIWVFILVYASALIYGIIVKAHFFHRLLVWFFTLQLFSLLAEVLTGGHNLMLILLFFHIFFFYSEKQAHQKVSRVMWWGAKNQFLWMYAWSLYFKLKGEDWMSGRALEIVFSDKIYSVDWVTQIVQYLNLTELFTYLILFYHVIFIVYLSLDLFFRRRPFKNLVFMLGVSFHLSIALVVGLPDFSLFVFAGYVLVFAQDRYILPKYRSKLEIVQSP